MNIVLCVSGSIAAYKAADIVNRLKVNNDIHVVMSESATKFITPLTFEALSQNKVYTDMFESEEAKISHIDIATNADLILVAPASANTISKLNAGIADNLLSTILIAAKPTKIIMAPAMNTNMYENPIIQKNIADLKEYGVSFIKPRSSLLACNTYGVGALATVEDIVEFVTNYELN